MRDRPDAATLDALADALGHPPDLATRCRAIAAREKAAGEGAFAAIRMALAARYGAGDDRFWLARLSAEIDASALDPASPARAVLAALLAAITRQKLSESNPDYLEAAAREPPLKLP